MQKTVTIQIPIEYKRLFDKDWRESAIYGGRYSLKSHTVARYLLIRARMAKTRVACFREFQNSIAESSHQLLKDLIDRYELKDFEVTNNSIINKINGSDFIFKGLANNEQSIKSIEGIDIAWVEEAQTITKDSIDILTPTVRKPGSQIIYTYNRIFEDDPIHQRLVIEGRPNTLVLNINYDIAIKYGWIPDVILNEIEDDKKSRPALYKHKWLGEPNSLEVRIYRDWNVIDEIPHEARLERIGVDFGYTNDPTAIIGIYYHNGAYLFDEICYKKGMSNKEISDTLKNLENQKLIIADSAEPKSIDELRSYGHNCMPAEKGQGSIVWGIQIVQDQRISVTKRSVNLIKEYRNYRWMTDRNGVIINTPEGGNDHAMDALRYGLSTLAKARNVDRIWEEEDKEWSKETTKSFNRGE